MKFRQKSFSLKFDKNFVENLKITKISIIGGCKSGVDRDEILLMTQHKVIIEICWTC